MVAIAAKAHGYAGADPIEFTVCGASWCSTDKPAVCLMCGVEFNPYFVGDSACEDCVYTASLEDFDEAQDVTFTFEAGKAI